MKTAIEIFLKSPNQKVGWIALTATGTLIEDDSSNWLTNDDFPILDGYEVARVVRGDKDIIYRVNCTISKTMLGVPFYTAAAFKMLPNGLFDTTEISKISSLKSTAVANNMLKNLKVNTSKHWSGPQFFGLYRADARAIIRKELKVNRATKKHQQNKTLEHKPSSSSTFEDSGGSCNTVDNDYNLTENCEWQKLGERVNGEYSPFYIKEHQGQEYYIHDGYVANRGVRCSPGNHVLATCIVKAQGSMPQYICEGNGISIQTDNITTTVQKFLKQVFCVSQGNWSGYEFFGFYRKDVFSLLKKKSVNKLQVDNTPLHDIVNIRNRNAGPTNQLKSKQSILKRNEKINAVVSYGSFGDVKSK